MKQRQGDKPEKEYLLQIVPPKDQTGIQIQFNHKTNEYDVQKTVKIPKRSKEAKK